MTESYSHNLEHKSLVGVGATSENCFTAPPPSYRSLITLLQNYSAFNYSILVKERNMSFKGESLILRIYLN